MKPTAIKGFLLMVLLTGHGHAQESTRDIIKLMVDEMAQPGILQVSGHRIVTGGVLQPFYANRDYTPAWERDDQIEELLDVISTAGSHGLHPEDYLLSSLREQLAQLSGSTSPKRRAQLDILMSESLVRYAVHRRFGKVDPQDLDQNINFRQRFLSNGPLEVSLQHAMDEGGFLERLSEGSQSGPWYTALREELRRLRALAESGGWPVVAAGPTLHPGDEDGRVLQLRTRLSPGGEQAGALFDQALEAEVVKFQRQHGLDADGVVGPATLRAMNVPVEQRIDQVRLSLERLRWVTSESEDNDDFIAVNIAGFRVYVVQDRQLAWTTRAMVGKNYRQTPIFRGEIQYMEFNPTWTVPPGILRNDILPRVKEDYGYLADKNMILLTLDGEEVDPATVDWQSIGRTAPYIFRQTPGPWNALGQVKFIFPNPHFVFLHDTSHRELFDNPNRAFSSGCIRVEHPLDLAELLLKRQSPWDRAAIDGLIESKKTRRVNLDEPLPVFILYLTAAPGLDGEIRYLGDVYGRDMELLGALNAPVAPVALNHGAR